MMWVYLLLLCFTTTLGCRPKEKKPDSKDKWEGGRPKTNSWKDWIQWWDNQKSSMAFDSTEVGKDPESGWPSYWKGLGNGIPGIPPPPWAKEPEQYGRASYCYLKPKSGNCAEVLIRWAFNSTPNRCESFVYSGCGGNENNFMQKYDCMDACGRVPSTGCDTGWVKFKKYIED